MNDAEIIQWIETKIDAKLSELQKAILKGTWEDKTYQEIARSQRYNLQYIKDVGYQLWELLSEICGEKIAKKTFRKKLEQYFLKLAPSTPLRRDWGDAPDIPAFFGRIEELAKLEQWIIQERCRLVAIVGIGGIGKTDLSVKLVRRIQDKFEYIIWRSLLNALPVTDMVTDWLEFLSDRQETEFPNTLEAQISRLLHYLREHPCLVILDNVEAILQKGERTSDGLHKGHRAGQYRQGYEGYGQLFWQVGEVSHQSCLLLTSREKPYNLARIAGKNHPVRLLELGGLDYLDARKILQAIGEFSGSDEEWQTLIKFYNGNPLVLELAAHHIQDVFEEDIGQFLKEGKLIFEDLRDLLDWHWDRLSELEKQVIYWLAINREPITLSALKEDLLLPEAKEQVTDTLQSLGRRLFLEQSAAGFTLQPLLIEYITGVFVEQVCEEIKTEKIYFLNNYAWLKALAKEYIREAQIHAILQPILERLTNILGSQSSLETCLKQMLEKLRKEYVLRAGYGAGNILNLLCQLKTNLKEYDFSHLTIWQAYLQGMNLAEVNFAGSKFAKSVFTQSFGGIHSVAFSPDEKLLAVGDAHGRLRLISVRDSLLSLGE